MSVLKDHDSPAPVAIIGAGIAGLTAAAYLKRKGRPFILYEAGKKVAGLATSYQDEEGFSYDFGAHFITNRLAAAIGVGAKCRTVASYGEAVLLEGRSYSYPFGLLQNFRFLMGGLASRFVPRPGGNGPRSAAEWFRAEYGRPLADRVAIPLLEAWSGAPADQLASSVGEKFQNSTLKTILLKWSSWTTGRAVACGYSHEMPENPDVWHVYPDGGVGGLCKQLTVGIEDEIRLESPVQSVRVEGGRVVSVRVGGREQPVSAVVSTAPCHALAKMVEGTDALQSLARFRYRPMVFINLRLRGRGLLPDTVLWTPESRFPFFRLTEPSLSMPWLAPEGKTMITVDIGCEMNGEIWKQDEAALAERCLEGLTPIIRDIRKRYLGCRVLRTPIAYPVYLQEYEEARRRFEQGTGIEGLFSIGRNGEFSHSLMEDVYWRTLAHMRDLLGLNGQASPTSFPAVAPAQALGC